MAGTSSKPTSATSKQQKSLTSFFGAATSSKTGEKIAPKKVQSTLLGGGAKKTRKKSAKKADAASAAGKENRAATDDDAVKSENEDGVPVEDEKPTKKKKRGDHDDNDEGNDSDGAVEANAEAKDDAVLDKAPIKKEKSARAGDGEGDDLMDTDDENEGDSDGRPLASLGKKRAVAGGKRKPPSRSGRAIIDDDDDDSSDDDDDSGDKAGEEKEKKKGPVEGSPTKKAKRAPVERKRKAAAAAAKKEEEVSDDGEEEMAEDDDDDDDDDFIVDYDHEEEEDDDEEEMAVDDDDGSVDEEDEQEEKPTKKILNAAGKRSKKKVAAVKSSSSPASSTAALSAKKKSNNGKKSKATAAETKSQKNLNDVLKHPPKASTASASSGNGKKKSELVAGTTKSDDQLLSDPDVTTWKDGSSVPYGALCETLEHIECMSGRLEITQSLTDFFRRVLLRNPTDMYDVTYLAGNEVAPKYECVELGIGDSILIKAIGEASGTNPNMVKQKYAAEGDLGTVAKTAKGKQKTLGFGAKPKPLLAKEVLAVFRQIATTTGGQSQKLKVDKIKGLLVRAQGPEAKYIIRGLQGKLRIGLAQSSVLVALAHAVALTTPKDVPALKEEALEKVRNNDKYPESARKLCEKKLPLDAKLDAAANVIKKAYSEVPSYDRILDAVLKNPLQEMHNICCLSPGLPVEPMLAKPTKSIQEVLKRLDGLRFTCEYKYDGERAQVHLLPDGTTKVFSRNLLDTSIKFPEVPMYVKEACKNTEVKSFVLDTEVVAFNRETKQFVPFQVLSTRKKAEESEESAKVQVIVQAFDLMYLNGVSLLSRTLAERRELLQKHFEPVEGKFQFATALDHKENGDSSVIEEFLDAAVKGQCEGLMVKTLDVNAVYEPSKRSLNWLKLKKDYLEGLGDSVDLVPLGAYHGKGKRTGVYGAYLLACYDEDTEEFQSVCKIGTGFSEEDLKNLSSGLSEHITAEKSPHYNVSDTLECDVWFDAVQVWEVKAADLSKSSTHKGAIDKTGEHGRGIGLRFPRFERIRDDKKPEQATSSDQILEMYYAQDSVVDAGGGTLDDDGI